MLETVLETNTEEIATLLSERRKQGKQPALFLGARAGGAFNNAYLYKTLRQFSLRNFDKLSSIEQFRECYRLLISEYFNENSRYEILVNAFGPLIHRSEDILLSGLVKAGFFKTIITTNIDMLLEEAFSAWGMWEPRDYRVYEEISADTDLVGEKIVERYIVKVFGNLNSLRHGLFSSNPNPDQDVGLTSFLKSQLSEEVVVIGFDSVWDRSIERMFPLEGNAVWYISETSLEENPYLADVLKLRGGKYLRGNLGSYSDFLRTLYVFLGGEVSREKAEPMPSLVSMLSSEQERKGIFISCSHKDGQYLERLTIHLKGHLLSQSEQSIPKLLQIWDDLKISSSKNWSEEIKNTLTQAQVAILLESNHFLASDAVREQEIPILLEAAQKGDLKLFSVILDSPSMAFDESRMLLHQYTTVYNTSEPLNLKTQYEQEIIWDQLAKQVIPLLGSQK